MKDVQHFLELKITRKGVEVYPELGGWSWCLGSAGLSYSNHTDSFSMESLKTVGGKSQINMSMGIFVTLIDKNVFQSYVCM